MKYVYVVLNWTLGVFFLFAGAYLLREFLLAGLALVLISLLLFPPVRTLVYSITKIEIPHETRSLAVPLLFIFSGVSVVASQAKTELELLAMQPESRIQSSFSVSQKRHRDFFGLDAWKHSDYVEQEGVRLCVVCHNLTADGPRNFGPRCVECHRDLHAFSDSINQAAQKE